MDLFTALLSFAIFLSILGFLSRNGKFEYVPETLKPESIEIEEYETIDVYDDGENPSIIWAFLCLALGPLGFILLLIIWLAPANPTVKSVKYKRIN